MTEGKSPTTRNIRKKAQLKLGKEVNYTKEVQFPHSRNKNIY